MTDYFIRTADRDTLLALGVQIGLLTATEGGGYEIADPLMGIWSEIGPVMRETGGVVTDPLLGERPELAPLKDPEGREYWHANLRLYTQSLGDLARAAYEANPTPELAAALASLSSYFVVDADGAPTAPGQPLRVFG